MDHWGNTLQSSMQSDSEVKLFASLAFLIYDKLLSLYVIFFWRDTVCGSTYVRYHEENFLVLECCAVCIYATIVFLLKGIQSQFHSTVIMSERQTLCDMHMWLTKNLLF
eukprot:GHVL01010682.1.p1 GENE.GHVL01010682.1~~GHVL01010682.1.p1  ORF type:complete len:109 (+),score=7.39 GHVL01010682.1:1488-1814(+)